MLRIQQDVLDWLVALAPLIRCIAVRDGNLADQLRRAATSVSLNLAEGAGAVGGNKRRAYRAALSEMREAVNAGQIAVCLGYLAPLDNKVSDTQSKIIGTLVRLARP